MTTYIAPPTLARFHKSDAFYRGVMGPIGSGKSTGCSWEVFRRAQEQRVIEKGDKRRSRWAVIRNTYRELQDTTIRTWLDWFPEGETGQFRPADMAHEIRLELEDGTLVECDVLFRALDRPQDVKKLLSLELTGAWVNEAREVPRSVVDMLGGRVGRFPSQREGGPSWSGVIMDTNPPDMDHWWYRLFEEVQPDGWQIFRQPSGLAGDAENLKNLPGGVDYYTRQMAGKDDEWINVYVHGDYGFVSDGKRIYPEWHDVTHVGDVEANPSLPLIVGIDFGLTPAATFGQVDALGRWLIVDEMVTEDMGAIRFAQSLKKHLQTKYRGFEVELWGDPAGEQRSQVDETTPFQVMQAQGLEVTPAPSNDFTIRREAVAASMQRMIDGKPGLRVSPDCRVLRKGLGGGYCYKRIQVAGDERYHDKPDKNRFSHVCDAQQYMMLGAGEGDTVVFHKPDTSAYVKAPMPRTGKLRSGWMR